MQLLLLVLVAQLVNINSDEHDMEQQLPPSLRALPNQPRPKVEFVAKAILETTDPMRSLRCNQKAVIYDGDQYLINSNNYPSNASLRLSCLWSFMVKPQVNVDVMCSDYNVPCTDPNAGFYAHIRTKWVRTCSEAFKSNQRFSIRTQEVEYRLSLFLRFWTQTGRLSCVVRGTGGMARPQEGPTVKSEEATRNGTKVTPQSFCGTNRFSSRIVNGEEAEENEFPWMAYIVIGRNACGGTVISREWILTAAHCTTRRRPSEIKVYLGCHFLTLTSCDTRRSISLNQVHENYNSVTLENDIALLKLSERIKSFSERVRPVCLPTSPVTTQGYQMVTVGWGLTSTNGRVSDVVKEAFVQSVRDSRCMEVYGSAESVLCTTAVTGTVCNGDSGGFLGSQRGPAGRYEQDGITSFGPVSGCEQQGVPDGFTEVYHYLDWITEKTMN